VQDNLLSIAFLSFVSSTLVSFVYTSAHSAMSWFLLLKLLENRPLCFPSTTEQAFLCRNLYSDFPDGTRHSLSHVESPFLRCDVYNIQQTWHTPLHPMFLVHLFLGLCIGYLFLFVPFSAPKYAKSETAQQYQCRPHRLEKRGWLDSNCECGVGSAFLSFVTSLLLLHA
jgi:hypothetical protein